MRLRRAGEACARWSHASTLLPHQDAQVRSFACARARVTLTEGGEAADHRAAETHGGWRPVDCAMQITPDCQQAMGSNYIPQLNLRFADHDSSREHKSNASTNHRAPLKIRAPVLTSVMNALTPDSLQLTPFCIYFGFVTPSFSSFSKIVFLRCCHWLAI